MKDLTTKFPYNLQFFAEGDPEPEPTPTPDPEPTPEPELSAEEQMQQIRIDNARLKKAMDKAASEAASYKKQLNAKMSADEVALQEKAEQEAEREEKFNQLVKENTVNKLAKNYMKLGYPEDKATEAATAQHEGDTEKLFKIQGEIQQLLVKQKEAEWIKSRPQVSSGVGEDDTKDAFLTGFNS